VVCVVSGGSVLVRLLECVCGGFVVVVITGGHSVSLQNFTCLPPIFAQSKQTSCVHLPAVQQGVRAAQSLALVLTPAHVKAQVASV
jgi:hypothetical protein